MLNSQDNEFTPATSLLQCASYFDEVDKAVRTGDTNKRYTMSTNASTAPSAPVLNGSFTSFIISPTENNMCDLYNSFLDVTLKIQVKTNAAWHANALTGNVTALDRNRGFWVGFKDSFDAVESYSIVVNGQSIYTQNYSIEESFELLVLYPIL
jgi:hypothetical protein